MTLTEALTKLKEGAIMCRAAWSEEEGYLKLMPGMSHVWKIQLKPNPNAGNYIFSYADLTNDDWKEFVVTESSDTEVKKEQKAA